MKFEDPATGAGFVGDVHAAAHHLRAALAAAATGAQPGRDPKASETDADGEHLTRLASALSHVLHVAARIQHMRGPE